MHSAANYIGRLAAVAVLLCFGARVNAQVINKDVTRTIDAGSAIVRISAEIKAVNVAGEYQIAFPTSEAKCLSYLSVALKGKVLPLSAPVSKGNTTLYTAQLGKDGGASVTLKLTAVLTSFLEPFPAEITQAESQLVRFTVSHWFLSPYSTESQKTTIKLASRAVESYTKRAPQALTGSTLTYGPYKDVSPWAYSAATVHSVNNKPFAKFSNINREIEVSHWGNVAIEETYELKHAGARLAGGFSRFDYKGGRTADSPSFRSLTALLPSQARDIYYRDQIGNISTSDLRKLDAGLEMEIQTRYPMFGGWQSQFYIGYNVPSETMLFVDSVTGRHNLKVDYFVPFDDVWVEDMEIKIVLPEGCSDVKIELPYAVEKQTWTTRFTYLDSVFNGGRKVLTLKASNLVEEFDKKIVVSYSFSRSRMLFEPLLLCVFFFFLFCACSLFARLNTVLEGKGDKEGKKSKSE